MDHLKFYQLVSSKFLNINAKIHPIKRKNQKSYEIIIGVTRLLETFKKLEIDFSDPPKPPKWIINNPELFGAYIAGIIDGDGNINTKRPENPQCSIRIFSGIFQEELLKSIMANFNCKCHITKRERESILNGRKIRGVTYALEFYVSNKNMNILRRYILPWIQIQRKRNKLESHIRIKWARPDSNQRSFGR